MEKITTQTLLDRKRNGHPIAAVTAYDAAMAHFADAAGVDLILVGDSVGTTQLGFPDTVGVTAEMMIHHTAAVARSRPKALLAADIPFGVAHDRFPALLGVARRLLQEGGAGAVKIEGGAGMASKIERLVDAGIPVIGHIGLLPQQIHQLGRYRKYGRGETEKASLVKDGLALEKAGCFMVVCESIEGTVAGTLAAELAIPLIGIGSGPHCDGQILVSHDLLGMTPGHVPGFARAYADVGGEMQRAFGEYAADVRNRKFPS